MACDPSIQPYLDHLKREGPGIPYVSTSHITLRHLEAQHGREIIAGLLLDHWTLLRASPPP